MRRAMLLGIVVMGVMVGACGKASGPVVPKATQNYDRVKEGMTALEVYDLLDVPDYSDGMIATKKDYWEEDKEQRIVVVFEWNATKEAYFAKSKGREAIPQDLTR